MESVIGQSYQQVEYIIIDGGSTDGSSNFIKNHQDSLAYAISVTDAGIYDAMNKGIDKATGEYILFLNSGDWLVDDFVIEKFVGLKPVEGIVYGDPQVRQDGKWRRKFMPKQMSIGVALTHTLNHQAEFYHNSIFNDNYRYDTSYKMISDWVLTTHAIIFKNCTTRYIDLVVCNFEDPGMSSDDDLRHDERRRYFQENFDPLFLKLFIDYRKLNGDFQILKENFLIQSQSKLLRYFKKQP